MYKQGIIGVESSTRKRDINTIYLPKQRTTTENEENLGETPSSFRQTEHLKTGHKAQGTGQRAQDGTRMRVARGQEEKPHSLLLSVSPATQSVGTCPPSDTDTLPSACRVIPLCVPIKQYHTPLVVSRKEEGLASNRQRRELGPFSSSPSSSYCVMDVPLLLIPSGCDSHSVASLPLFFFFFFLTTPCYVTSIMGRGENGKGGETNRGREGVKKASE